MPIKKMAEYCVPLWRKCSLSARLLNTGAHNYLTFTQLIGYAATAPLRHLKKKNT